MISAGSVGTFCSKITLPASSTTPTFPSPTHQDPRNAPSDRSFLDARGRADLDPIIVTEGDAHSSSKPEPQPPRYTIWTFDARDRMPRPSRATAHHLVEIAPTATPAPLPRERVRSSAPSSRSARVAAVAQVAPKRPSRSYDDR